MPTLKTVRDKANAWLSDKWPTVRSRQDTYYANRGKYYQALWSHVATPRHDSDTDGDTEPDNLSSRPTDQAETWLDMFSEFSGAPIAARIRIDTYGDDRGDGYVATVQVRYNGTTYERSQNVGHLSERTQDWHVVDEAEERAT